MKFYIIMVLGLALANPAWAQGSLTPPGAPAPTMQTLAQMEPRTPILSLPCSIYRPGSYYLTSPLSSTEDGVVIQSSHVTVDLMGFSIDGNRRDSRDGIRINGPFSDIVVRGGRVSGFDTGVRLGNAIDSRIENMMISSNSSYGVCLAGRAAQPCDGNIITDCAIGGNGASGISFLGQCVGNVIANCSIGGNALQGVYLYGYPDQCNGNTVRNCSISGNGSTGVMLSGEQGQCNGNTVRDCAISGNGQQGVWLFGTGGQCDGNTVDRCLLSNNSDTGIYLISADGNRIENNHVSGTTGSPSYGIRTVASTANLIFQNICVGQTTNFNIAANDTYGPIATSSGPLATTNGAAALSPWANFSR